jgi:cytidine deaminase
MFSSYNVKQHSLQPKICGERTNLERAHEEGFTYCVGLVIMSLDVQTDPGSGIQSITEPPCGVCRLDLATNPLIDGDTDITCATPDGYYERHSVDEILGIYGCPT